MKKILVAHDGSDVADRALFAASAVAEKFGAHLTVISVVPDLCFTEIGVDCVTVNNLYRAEIEGVMEGVKASLEERKVHADTIILEGGNPADVIVDQAKGMGFDMIVVGAMGKQATERTLFGSVSQRIAANAPCSVLVVR
ncbi:MAG: universal stress protein [Dissulfurispiraceae bacterium]